MRFWDASAIVPIVVIQPESERVAAALASDEQLLVWWATLVECHSAIARLERDGAVLPEQADHSRLALERLSVVWSEIDASDECRERARSLVRRHPLRAADALQLAAALTWADGRPRNHAVCSLDARLVSAARSEGFEIALGP